MSRNTLILLLALGVLGASGLLFQPSARSARGQLPAEAYAQARDKAALQLRVRLTRVVPPATTPGLCVLEGTVVQALRAPADSRPAGQTVRFSTSCRRPDELTPPGPVLWQDLTQLQPGRVLEGFFDPPADKRSEELKVARWNLQLLAPEAEAKPASWPAPGTPGAAGPSSAPAPATAPPLDGGSAAQAGPDGGPGAPPATTPGGDAATAALAAVAAAADPAPAPAEAPAVPPAVAAPIPATPAPQGGCGCSGSR